MYCKSKCTLVQGRNIHDYETRGRNNFRLQQHRTTAFTNLPKQVGVRLINGLPEVLKNIQNLNQFKSRLKHLLVSGVFYSVDESLTCRWEN